MLPILDRLHRSPQFPLRAAVYLVVLLMAVCQFFFMHLIYIRSELLAEPWRFWTAHWVHIGFWHWLLNAVALALLPEIFPKSPPRFFMALWLLLPVLLSLAFWFFLPKLWFYAGLSGVLHGIYLALALVAIQDGAKIERQIGWILAIGLCAKVGWEAYSGTSQTAALIGAPVVLQAHQYGAGLGLFLWIVRWSVLRLKKGEWRN